MAAQSGILPHLLRDVTIGYFDRLENVYKQQNSVLATDAWREEDLQVYDQSSSQWRFYWTSLNLPVLPGSLEILFGHALDKSDDSLPNFRLALAVAIPPSNGAKELKELDDQILPGGNLQTIGLLLLTAKSDPVLSDDKEEDDEAWQRKEVAAVTQHEAAKTMAGINITFLISKVQDEGPAIDLSTFVAVDIAASMDLLLAKTKTSAVSCSGRGLLYSLGRYDITSRDVCDDVMTIKPRKDIVPQVDKLGGLVQEIRCKSHLHWVATARVLIALTSDDNDKDT
ncbi:unnamed protein product [Peronospora destructor]|uniref:Uncharacterized protein n=1 Tax=Peronospora destructor TaxID=86335 RepID=A0AAV0UIK2_9STRA|nr:unnamed protein product [Peronospora destructor]